MRTFIADIIPRIQKFSKKLDDLTNLTNQHWVSLGDITQVKRVFIFRGNNELIISENGKAEKGSWEYLGNQSLLIETKNESLLLKHGFFDENIIALKLDSTDSYAFFVNETKYNKELNSIEDVLKFLEGKYVKKSNLLFESSANISCKYSITNKYESFTLMYGFCIVYEISFYYGAYGKIHMKKSNNRFYFYTKIYGEQSTDNLEKAIEYMSRSV